MRSRTRGWPRASGREGQAVDLSDFERDVLRYLNGGFSLAFDRVTSRLWLTTPAWVQEHGVTEDYSDARSVPWEAFEYLARAELVEQFVNKDQLEFWRLSARGLRMVHAVRGEA